MEICVFPKIDFRDPLSLKNRQNSPEPVKSPRHKTNGTLLKGWQLKSSIKEFEFLGAKVGSNSSVRRFWRKIPIDDTRLQEVSNDIFPSQLTL